MHPDHLRVLIHAVPFVPFNVRMGNDRLYYVDHPELISFSRDGWSAAIAEGEHGIVHVAVRNIHSLEPVGEGGEKSPDKGRNAI